MSMIYQDVLDEFGLVWRSIRTDGDVQREINVLRSLKHGTTPSDVTIGQSTPYFGSGEGDVSPVLRDVTEIELARCRQP